MSIVIGHTLEWRFQGIKSSCWLTCIEMLMQHKYGSIYGKGKNGHSQAAEQDFKRNSGSHIGLHAKYYNLMSNDALRDCTDMREWEIALRNGPVIAEGKYGWSRIGIGMHVVVIAGISKQNKLAFYNPNVFAVLPHPVDKISYFSLEDCIKLARKDTFFAGGPFWQVAEDIPATHRVSK